MAADALWDIGSVVTVGVIVAGVLVRRTMSTFSRKAGDGCGGGCGCSGGCKEPEPVPQPQQGQCHDHHGCGCGSIADTPKS